MTKTFTYRDGRRVLRRYDFPGKPQTLAAGDDIEVAGDGLETLELGTLVEILPAGQGKTERYLVRLWATVDVQTGDRRSHPPREREIVLNGLARPTGTTYRVRRHEAARVDALEAAENRNRGPRHDEDHPARFGRRGRRRSI